MFDTDNIDINLDTNLDLDLNIESLTEQFTDITEMSVELEEDSQLISDFGLLGIDLNEDADGADIILDIEDDANISISFDGEDSFENLEVTEEIQNISKIFGGYFDLVNSFYSRVKAMKSMNTFAGSWPDYVDFNFIDSEEDRQNVFKFFCTMIEDLVTQDRYRGLSTEDAYKVFLDEMYNVLYYTPSVFNNKLKEIFTIYYDTNLKLVKAKSLNVYNDISDYIPDKELEDSSHAYYINSVPWNLIAQFLENKTLINSRGRINVNDYGEFISGASEKCGSNKISFDRIYDYIISYLTDKEVLNSINVTVEQSLDLHYGEILRRLVQKEINDDKMIIVGLSGLNHTIPINQCVGLLYNSLLEAIKLGSIMAEIICVILELILNNIENDKNEPFYFNPIIIGLSEYFKIASEDTSFINPVFFNLISKNDNSEPFETIELGYNKDNNQILKVNDSILCKVVGDKQSVYHVPLVMLDYDNKVVVCPPEEVVSNVRRSALGTRISKVNSRVCYKLRPTYKWLSGLNIMSQDETKSDDNVEHYHSKGNNPLLQTLILYDNSFTKEVNVDNIKTIISNNDEITILTKNNSEQYTVLMIIIDGKFIKFDNAVCFQDEDALILRYIVNGSEFLKEYKNFNFKDLPTVDDSNNLNNISIFNSIIDYKDNLLYRLNRMIALNKLLCDRCGMYYEQELEYARRLIVSNLHSILGIDKIDRVIAGYILDEFYSFIEQSDFTIDSFNYETICDLFDILSGTDNIFKKNNIPNSDELKDIFNSQMEKDSIDFYNVFFELNSYNLQFIALSLCGVNSDEYYNDYVDMYNAISEVPRISTIFKLLEQYTVLFRLIFESLSDIGALCKTIPVLNDSFKLNCIFSNVNSIEKNMKVISQNTDGLMPILRDVLMFEMNNSTEVMEHLKLIKLFLFGRNIYGLISELEELVNLTNDSEIKYTLLKLKEMLNIKDIEIKDMSDKEFTANFSKEQISMLYVNFNSEFNYLIKLSVYSEIILDNLLQYVKVYEIFANHVFDALKISDKKFTSAEDNIELADFNSYFGSFLISYLPVVGEAIGDIDGGFDRYSAYLMHRKDFISKDNLTQFEKYNIRDLRYLASSVSDDILEDSGLKE